jgi:hypothetical protein
MPRIKALALSLALLLSSQMAAAQTTHRIRNSAAQTALSLVPLDGSGASLAFTVVTTGYAVVNVYLHHVVNATAENIVMSCTTSDGTTSGYILQDCNVSAGDCTSSDSQWTKAVTGAKKWPWQVHVLGYGSVTCTMSSALAGATDTISATYHVVTQ